ncbi:hypothetical protein ABZ671_11110 [Micromonospora sp. NPDC006766]|uniref:hypothetical protein n=1 Tax=Micromonospora sp. NPDC006766 TaxID=3154778 RepID=UPI0033F31ADD
MHPTHSPAGRLTALGTQLIEIHDWLREELDGLAVLLTAGDLLGLDVPDEETN